MDRASRGLYRVRTAPIEANRPEALLSADKAEIKHLEITFAGKYDRKALENALYRLLDRYEGIHSVNRSRDRGGFSIYRITCRCDPLKLREWLAGRLERFKTDGVGLRFIKEEQ